jgi:DNA polymerase V
MQTDRPAHKELSRGGSLGGTTADPARLRGWLARNVERLVEELEYHVVVAGRLQVYLSHTTGQGGGWEVTLPAPTDRFDLLLDAAYLCFDRAWMPGRGVSGMHLIATDLRRPGFVQLGLFEPPEKRARAVARLKREVNAKLGRFTLRSGATLPLADVYRDEAQSYDVCDIHGKTCF